MGNYLKAWVAFLGAVASSILVYLDDNVITVEEIPLIVAGIAVLVGTYLIPNKKNGENVNALADEALRKRRISGV